MTRGGTAAVLAFTLVAGCGDGEPAASEPPPPPAESGAGVEAGRAPAEVAQRGVRLVRVGTFSQPTYLTAPPADRRRLFVVEQEGVIRVIRDGRRLARPFLDIRASVQAGGERGLLSMAFAPDYSQSRRFYVYFTGRDGDIRIQEFRRSRGSAERAAVGSRREIMRIEHSQYPNHNGGQLQFGPDRLLYIGTGDGGGGGDPLGNAQRTSRLLGKLLRIDPRARSGRRYSVPPGNPFRGRSGARREVYAYGLRNPWRFSFDRSTGDITIGDVGQNAVEEINFARRGRARGRNFGWNVFEGTRRYSRGSAPGHAPPVIEHLHSNGACSITGGYVVRDRRVAGLYGRYVYGDVCDDRIRSARLATGRAFARRTTGLRVPNLVSFGEDARGRVYALSLNGPVYRIAARG